MDVTAQTAQQFVEEDKVVAMLGYTDTDSVLAAGPVFQNAGIPFVTVGATCPSIPSQIGDLMFLACFGDNVQAAAGAEYALQAVRDDRLPAVGQGPDLHDAARQYFKSRFTQAGGTIVARGHLRRRGHRLHGPDHQAQGAADAAGLLLHRRHARQHRPVVKQMRDAGLTAPSWVATATTRPTSSAVAGAAANDVYFTTHALMDANGGTDRIKKFIAAYQAEYGHALENAFAALGYDTVYLMADAIKRAGSTDAAGHQDGPRVHHRLPRASPVPSPSASGRTSPRRA